MRQAFTALVATFAIGCVAGLQAAEASCTVSVTGPSFGTYAPLTGAQKTATGVASVLCTTRTSVVVALSSGSGTFAQRTMLGPKSPTLKYNLYTDATYGTVWGDGTQSTGTVGATFSGSFPFTFYGRVLGSQDVPIGSYSDTVISSVTF